MREIQKTLKRKISQSIYYNVLPYRSKLLDVHNVDIYGEEFAKRWLKDLLDAATIDSELNAKPSYEHKLKHHYFNALVELKKKGKTDFGFGYPMIHLRRPARKGGDFFAPLFIWSIKLRYSQNRENSWSLQHSSNSHIYYNPILPKLLEEDFDLAWEKGFKNIINQGKITTARLSEFCNDLSVRLDVAGNTSCLDVRDLPKEKEIDSFEKFNIVWSGVFGAFPHFNAYEHLEAAKSFSVDGLNNLLAQSEKPNAAPLFCKLPNPDQKQAVHHALSRHLSLIKGSQNTTGTDTIFEMAINLLAQGKRTVIVSPSYSTLLHIQNALLDLQLGRLSFIIKDLYKDKEEWLSQLQALPSFLKKSIKYDANEYEIRLNRFKLAEDKLDANQKTLHSKNFGIDNWQNTVGKYIVNQKQKGKELLGSQLSEKDFQFSFREYDELIFDIRRSEQIFNRLGRLNHPLSVLHDDIFINHNKENAKEYLLEQLNAYKDKAQKIHFDLIIQKNEYGEALREYYHQGAEELQAALSKVQYLIAENVVRFGEPFITSSTTKLNVYSVFSEKYHNIKEEKEKVLSAYNDLMNVHSERQHFAYKFAAVKDINKIKIIHDNVHAFEESLATWQSKIPSQVSKEANSTSSKSLHLALVDYNSKIGELEYRHEQFVLELNEAKLFKEWFDATGNTLPQRQLAMQTLIEQLDGLAFYYDDFEDYYDWHKNWLSISTNSQKAALALATLRSDDWITTFNSWYFYQCSSKVNHTQLLNGNDTLLHFTKLEKDLQDILPAHILALWQTKQKAQLLDFKKANRDRYKEYFSTKKNKAELKESLKAILTQSAELSTTAVPLIMATLDTAPSVLAALKGNFDTIIINEAEEIPLQEATTLINNSAQTIILGENELSPLDATQSLYDFMTLHVSKIARLRYTTQFAPTDLFRFYNAAFYKKRLKTLATYGDLVDTVLHEIHGKYDSKAKINRLEASRIEDILLNLPKKSQEHFPKIAIVCSTLEQRDIISSNLLTIMQKRLMGSGRIKQMLQDGLAIFDANNLCVDDYDVVIWSLTYGSINFRDEVTKDISAYDSTPGIHSINAILQLAKDQLILVSSLPQKFLKLHAESLEHTGKTLISKLIIYCKALMRKDDALIQKLIHQFALDNSEVFAKERHAFREEMKNALSLYFPKEKINQNTPFSTLSDNVIAVHTSPSEPPITVIIDTLDLSHAKGAYTWESTLVERLDSMGYPSVYTYSVNWWKNPKQEARKLAGKLIRMIPKETSVNTQ